jgi:leucyl-tRNA synthetase
MAERKTLSLGNVAERERSAEDAARAWKISETRAAALKERARDMRRNPAEAQRILWEHLKDKQCGFTFNREVVMGSAIVDFACKTRWLVVEIGGTGDDAEATLAMLSDRKLTDVGVRVMRFAEKDVLEDADAVVKAIKDELQKPFAKSQTQESSNAPDQ